MKKTKTKIKTKRAVRKVNKVKHYEPHYLAIALLAFTLVEGLLFTTTKPADWQSGLAVLDVSSAVSTTVADTSFILQPVGDAVSGVNQFYEVSATAMIDLLDMGDEGPIAQLTFVTDSVYEFYQQASSEMMALLDVTETMNWSPQVAGASVSAQR
ncbi:MAG: hypothetical protein KW802_01180 [Candidatus Doudnabacteria bacterium]|nr:hypothetical protein [Candidatus Doudnabacteria bacterium]